MCAYMVFIMFLVPISYLLTIISTHISLLFIYHSLFPSVLFESTKFSTDTETSLQTITNCRLSSKQYDIYKWIFFRIFFDRYEGKLFVVDNMKMEITDIPTYPFILQRSKDIRNIPFFLYF